MTERQFYSGGLMDLSTYRMETVSDSEQWDSFVENSDQGTIFDLSAFTDSFATPVTNFGFYKGAELHGGITFVEPEQGVALRHELMIYNSPILRKPDQQQARANQFAEQFRTLAAMVRDLTARFKKIEFQTHYSFVDTRTFEWFNYGLDLPRFEFYPRHTSIIKLSDSFGFENDYMGSPLYLQCSKSRRQEIRYALKKGVNVECKYEPETFIKLYSETFERQGVQLDEASLNNLLILCDALDKNQKLKMYLASDKDGNVGSVAVFGLDSKRAYYLYGANSPVARDSHTGSMVLFSAFLDLMKLNVKEVDLEGINSPARGHFKMSFGGVMRSYSSIKLQA